MTSGNISAELRKRARKNAGNRCGYCLSAQKYVFAPLEIDHIVPQAAGGSDEEDNLWLACPMCNNYKGAQTDALAPETGEQVRLFEPQRQKWLGISRGARMEQSSSVEIPADGQQFLLYN